MDKFDLIKIIGEGTFGKVYLAKHKSEHIHCVIKEIGLTKVKLISSNFFIILSEMPSFFKRFIYVLRVYMRACTACANTCRGQGLLEASELDLQAVGGHLTGMLRTLGCWAFCRSSE